MKQSIWLTITRSRGCWTGCEWHYALLLVHARNDDDDDDDDDVNQFLQTVLPK